MENSIVLMAQMNSPADKGVVLMHANVCPKDCPKHSPKHCPKNCPNNHLRN